MRLCRQLPRQRWHLRGHRLAAWLGVLALCLRLLLPALHDHAAHRHGPWPHDGGEATEVATCACGHHHGLTRRGSELPRAALLDAQVLVHDCLACDFEAFAPAGAAPASGFAEAPVLPVAGVWPLRPAAHPELASPAATGRGPPGGALPLPRTIRA